MNQPLFTGACTALVTPFFENRINYPMLQQLIQRQNAAGITSIVVSGTTGESPTLSDSEKIELFQKSKQYASQNSIIIAGTGSNCTEHTIALSQAAESVGVDALLVVSPYYNKATPDGILKHYYSIAQEVKIPIIIYNVPSRTGLDIPVSVYKRLSEVSNIVGVKEANTNISKITKIMNECSPEFSVWSGNDDLAVPIIAIGGRGVISVSSNICPIQVNDMCRAALDGDFDSAADLHRTLQPLNDLLFCEVNPIPVKAAMKMIGYDCGGCRLPLSNLSEENRKKLSQFFSEK